MKKRSRKKLWYGLLRLGGAGAVLAFLLGYTVIRMPNVCVDEGRPYDLYVPAGMDVDSLMWVLERDSVLCRPRTFLWLAGMKDLPGHLKTGHYVLRRGMNNREMVNMLRGGYQVPVRVVFNHITTVEELAGVVARQLAFDSLELVHLLKDTAFIGGMGFDTATVIALFLPDTYEFYWNVSPRRFVKRMYREYHLFWDGRRREQARALGLTPVEVAILASIVQREALHDDEMPRIAGVYLNRLKRGMRLQADPTVVFAMREKGRKRVLKKDLHIDSPYNTYRYAGLPPGPICMPGKRAIDAVLQAEKHHYLYFCAREDFSGYHNFARTLAEHNRNARRYRHALNQRRIYR